ncbi:hypothetical protein DFJ74DRAFT_759692 [Hyaloraphidium curvatum]|nr:hypothetical protein DFJ74DRAFT_759692 [Hyaloraphidium curvatum]
MELVEDRVKSFAAKPAWYAKKKGKLAPQKLAEAGFFYEGKTGNPKRITCYLCRGSTDEAPTDADPLEAHAEDCPECPLVLLRVRMRRWVESSGAEHVEFAANTERMLAARLATFEKGWPHTEEGWNCTAEKLAAAGFSFRPNEESSDFAECLCCNLGLAGWEKDDDPVHEHRKRTPNCLYFRFPAQTKAAGPSKAPKTAKSAPPAEEAEPVPAPTEKEKPKAKPVRKRAARKEAREDKAEAGASQAEPEKEEEKEVAAEEAPADPAPSQESGRPSVGATQPEAAEWSQVAEAAAEEDDPKPEPSPPAGKKGKAKRKGKAGKKAAEEEAPAQLDENAPELSQSQGRSRGPQKQAAGKGPAKEGAKDAAKEAEDADAMDVDAAVESIAQEGSKVLDSLKRLGEAPGSQKAASPAAARTVRKAAPRELTPEELDMTVEEFLRSLIDKEKATFEAEGRRLVDSWKAKVELVRNLLAQV